MDIVMKDSKRPRSINFTRQDCELLIEAVNRHSEVINNKKTDAVTWQEKNAEWEQVALELNAGAVLRRTGLQYRLKYEGIKRETRKAIALDKQQLYATGGDKFVKPIVGEDNLYDRVRKMIPVSAEGLSATTDSDSLPAKHLGPPTQQNNTNAALGKAPPGPDDSLDSFDDDVYHVVEEITIPANNKNNDVEEQSGTSNIDWGKYSPAMLKTPKNVLLKDVSAWKGRRRPQPTEPRAKEIMSKSVSMNSFSKLADSKQELAELQIKILQQEHVAKQTHQDELNALDIKIKQAILKGLQLDNDIKQATLNKLNQN